MLRREDDLAVEFLSQYTAHKLRNGGEPAITARELQYAAESLVNSIYGRQRTVTARNLVFDDLPLLAAEWQNRADALHHDPALGFVYRGDRLLPTYAFHDWHTKPNQTLAHFFDHAPLIVMNTASTTRRPVDTTTHVLATVAANYLTNYFAQKYIDHERQLGHWPSHLTDLHYLYQENLAKTLQLPGDKKYFRNFRTAATNALTQLILASPDGEVRLTDQVSGTLAYNNLRRLTLAYPLLDELATSDLSAANRQKCQLFIQPNAINVTEQTLLGKKQLLRHQNLTPARLLLSRAKLRHLNLGERLHVLRQAVTLLTNTREK